MPLSDIGKATLGGAAAQAGSSLMGGIFSMIGAKKQRQFEMKMYDKQVATERANWEMENLYNSPEAQMERLKKAGLNPNLVYGNGATATGGSINSSSPSISDQSGKLAPFANLGNNAASALNSLYDLRIKNAQANLLTQKSETEQTIQALNATKDIYTQTLQYGEEIKNSLGQSTFNEIIKQTLLKSQQLQADLLNTQADTTAKTQSANLAGAKTKETNLSNELLELEKNLYKGTLGIPSQSVEQLIKMLMLILRKK